MSRIRRALRIDPDTLRTVVGHLDRHVTPHLAPDVSNYARGRQRAWLQVDAPLGRPTRTPARRSSTSVPAPSSSTGRTTPKFA